MSSQIPAAKLTPLLSAAQQAPVSKPASGRRLSFSEQMDADVAAMVKPKSRPGRYDEQPRHEDQGDGGSRKQQPIAPLQALALATRDPIKKSMLQLFDELSRLTRQALRQLAREFAAPTGAGPPRDLPKEQTRLVLQLIGQVRGLAKDLLVLWQPKF